MNTEASQYAAVRTIHRFETRHYKDSGATVAYCDWTDSKGRSGRTEGEPSNAHMMALKARAIREGGEVTSTEWL